MANIRNDSEAVAEAYRQADIITHSLLGDGPPGRVEKATYVIANALMDIWQEKGASNGTAISVP